MLEKKYDQCKALTIPHNKPVCSVNTQ